MIERMNISSTLGSQKSLIKYFSKASLNIGATATVGPHKSEEEHTELQQCMPE